MALSTFTFLCSALCFWGLPMELCRALVYSVPPLCTFHYVYLLQWVHSAAEGIGSFLIVQNYKCYSHAHPCTQVLYWGSLSRSEVPWSQGNGTLNSTGCVQVAFQSACISYSPISNVGVWFPARLPCPPKNTTHFQLFFPMVKLTHYLKEKNKSRDTEKHKEENKDHSKFTTQTELTIPDISE